MPNRLEQYLEKVSQPLPISERTEWRIEAEQHLTALIDAYEELGHSPAEATELALAKFGGPERLGRQMHVESLLTHLGRNAFLRSLAEVSCVSLWWSLIWAVTGGFLTASAGLLAPGSIGPEGSWEVGRNIGLAGTAAGLLFGLLRLVEKRRSGDKPLGYFRAALLGALGGGLSTALDFNQMYFVAACMFGVTGAIGSTWMESFFRKNGAFKRGR